MAKNLRDTAIREFRQRYAAFCCIIVLLLAVVGFAGYGAADRASFDGEDGSSSIVSTARCDVKPIVTKCDVKEYGAILQKLDLPQQ